MRRKLPRVLQQVHHHDAQQPWIAISTHSRCDRDTHGAFGIGRRDLAGNRLHQVREIQIDGLQLATSDLRQRQQRIDELRHARCGSSDAMQIAQPFVVQLLRVFLQQQLTEAVDAAQRSTQIVRDRIIESFQLAIRGLQCRRALLQRRLQPALVLTQPCIGRMLVKRNLDDTTQVRRFERLDEIGRRIRVPRTVQRVVVRVCGQEHHRHIVLLANGFGGRDPVDGAVESYVHQDQVRMRALGGPTAPCDAADLRFAARTDLNSSSGLRRRRALRPARRPPCWPWTPRRRA